MKIFTSFVVAFCFSVAMIAAGCSYLMQAQDKSAEQVSKAIGEYCKNTDEKFRTDFRAAINAKAAPNAIEVICK